jgi:hypothetical protein
MGSGDAPMKRLIMIVGLLSASAVGQNGFTATIPDRPVNFSQVNDSSAWVKGHWVGSNMVGPTVSEISCNHSTKTCTDTSSTIYSFGETFTLDSNQDEYKVERWDKKEIVASNVDGSCRVRNVIKFDRLTERIYWMQTLSEPIDDLPKSEQEACKFAHMHLELKGNTTWKR